MGFHTLKIAKIAPKIRIFFFFGVSSANVEEIPRPLLWGASRDSFRDQDESSIIADSMIAQSCAKKERVSAAPLRFPIAV